MDGVPVARLFGIEIRIHWSWVLILALVAALAAIEAGLMSPQLEPAVQWVIGGLVAAGFLASAAAHDLGHAVMSRRRGVPVDGVAVSFFGGSSPFDRSADDPRDEVMIAAAGPLVSLIAGSFLCAGSLALGAIGGPALTAVGVFGLMLGGLNFVLGLLNLLPAYPLDGGRLFRALIWARTGDQRRGTRLVARSGALLGLLLLAAGVLVTVYNDIGNGMMVLLCGWFLRLTARGAQARVELEELAEGLRVGDVMEPVGIPVSPGLTIDTFVGQVLDGSPPRTAVLVSRGDEILGLIGAAQIRRLARPKWATTHVQDVMVPRGKLADLSPDSAVWPAFVQLRDAGLDGLPVAGPDGPAGILTVRGIAAAIQARRPNRRPGLRLIP
jgi:Zn-dependent protease